MPPFLADFLMGGVSGAVSKTAAAPIERVRLLIQNQDEMIKAGRLARRYDGIVGLYRGFFPSILGAVAYRGLYFGMYNSLKLILLVGSLKGNFLASFALVYCITTAGGIAVYLLDTIRWRMMTTSSEKAKYKSSWDAGRQIVAKNGAKKALFNRARANILRALLALEHY